MTVKHVLGALWLGHGRMTEATLAAIAMIYGVLLFAVPSVPWESQATRDIAWHGYGHLIAVPFLLKALLTGLGLFTNIVGLQHSRFLRLCGASLGSGIWTWVLSKFALNGVPFTFGSVCAFIFLILSVRIIGMAAADLPKPGSPGSL